MNLYIDADAFANALKPILMRAIHKYKLNTFVVSNKKLSLGEKSSFVHYVIVEKRFDEADNYIVEQCKRGDIVITADIILADKLVSKEVFVLDQRGEFFTKENIKYYLAMRNLMQELRDSGEKTKGPKPFSQKDAHAFANALQQLLSKK